MMLTLLQSACLIAIGFWLGVLVAVAVALWAARGRTVTAGDWTDDARVAARMRAMKALVDLGCYNDDLRAEV